MNSPYRAHPTLPVHERDNTIAFRAPAPPAPPKPVVPSKLERLLSLEADIRQQPKRSSLALHALNETRALLEFEQAFLFRLNSNGKPILDMASSVSRVELHAPLSQAITKVIRALPSLDKRCAVGLDYAQHAEDYPFPHGLWVPLLDKKTRCFSGLLFARARPFEESDGAIAERLGQTYAHAFLALTPPSLLRVFTVPNWLRWSALLVTLGLIFIPVAMTSLAPFEVGAKDAAVVSSPLDGAIAEVVAEPNSLVKKGDVLFRFEDTILTAEAEIARQRALVAAAKLATATNGAFSDLDMKRSLAELKSEVELAEAERDFAASLLQRSIVVAARDGLLVFSSKSEWVGKPVRVGEKIMEVADPAKVEYRLDLAVHDSISLQAGSQVKLFLDSDPLNPRRGAITEMSYHATQKAGGAMAYGIRVAPSDNSEPVRIGLRGTAQLSGDTVSLGFYLLRRPIAALRQYFGY